MLIVFCGDFQYFCIFRRSCLSGRLRGCLIQRPSSSVLPGRVVKMAYPGYAKIFWNFHNIIQQFDISNLITSIEIFMNYPKFPFLFSIFEIFTKFPFFPGYARIRNFTTLLPGANSRFSRTVVDPMACYLLYSYRNWRNSYGFGIFRMLRRD